ncbi:MAG UNVERIFIED_CONTAM: hypothetical protein LVR29_28615 [Microcystis novacekii LVE1205-3]
MLFLSVPKLSFTLTEAKNRLLITYKMRSLEGMGLNIYPSLFAPARGLLEYIEDTQKANQVPLQPLKTYSVSGIFDFRWANPS